MGRNILNRLFKGLRANRGFRTHRGYVPALIASLLVVSLQSCSDEVIEQPGTSGGGIHETENSGYWITLNVQTPNSAGTRAETTPNGGSDELTVDATTNESLIKDATIYLCKGDDVVLALPSDYIGEESSTNPAKTHQIRVKIEDVKQLTKLAGEAADANLIIVANGGTGGVFTNPLSDQTGSNSLSAAKLSFSDMTAAPLGDFGNDNKGKVMPLMNHSKFPLNGLQEITETKPDDILKAVKALFSRDTGTILWYDIPEVLQLERGVARLEYRDKNGRDPEATTTDRDKALPAHTFWIGDLNVKIQLHSLQVFNVNTKSYLFRQTAAGDDVAATGNLTLLGDEKGTGTGYNWVASPDWGTTPPYNKTPDLLNTLNFDTSYLVESAPGVESTAGRILVKNLDTRTTSDKDGYHPWCYVSENTLPSTALFPDYESDEEEPDPEEPTDPSELSEPEQQSTRDGDGASGTPEIDEEKGPEPIVTKYATGVAFKFLVLDKNGDPLQYEPASTGGDDVVAQNAGTRDGASKYPTEITNSDENVAKKAIIITDSEGKWVEVFPEDYEDENGTTQTGYFLTYIAPIVHNAPKTGYDPANGKFPPMYYGVVRNNTYQISINSIAGLPRPKDPRTLFISLDIKVLAWTVRQTEYEF